VKTVVDAGVTVFIRKPKSG